MKNRMRTLACVMALSLSGIAFAAQQAAGAGSQGKKRKDRAAEVAQELASTKIAKARQDILDSLKIIRVKNSKHTINDTSRIIYYLDQNFKNELALIDGGKHFNKYCRLLRKLMHAEFAVEALEKFIPSACKQGQKIINMQMFRKIASEAKKELEPFDQMHKLFMQPKEKSAAQLKHEEEMRLAAERKAKEKAERAEKHKRLEEAAQAEKARRKAEKDALKKAQAEEDARAKQEREALQAEVELLRKCRLQQAEDFEKERREKLAQIEAEKERALVVAQAELEASGTAALLAAEQAKREEAEAAHAKLVKRIEGLREQLAAKSKEIALLGQQADANTAQALQEHKALQSKLQAEQRNLQKQLRNAEVFINAEQQANERLRSHNKKMWATKRDLTGVLQEQEAVLSAQSAIVAQQQQQLARFRPVVAVSPYGTVLPVYATPPTPLLSPAGQPG